jgi:hypothetical protein
LGLSCSRIRFLGVLRRDRVAGAADAEPKIRATQNFLPHFFEEIHAPRSRCCAAERAPAQHRPEG